MRFSKCSTCIDKKEQIGYSMSTRVKDEARTTLMKHYELVKKERSVYYHKRLLARSEPDKYLSIIVDGYKILYCLQKHKHNHTKTFTILR